MKEPMNDLVEFLLEASYEDLPLDVVTHVRKLLFDTIAISSSIHVS